MTAPTIAELLKYADLQMAAEAFLVDPNTGTPIDLKTALMRGNDHSSKFTATQADSFVANWEVVAQKPNTKTGFSGTLFKYIGPTDAAKGLTNGELVLSFRSTEFVDDAARDNQATNTLEVKNTGFAWGQLADMQKWYGELKADPLLLGNKTFSLTGYSLGGHLATAFNLLNPTAAAKTVTFNGAGVGKIKTGDLTQALADFNALRGDPELIKSRFNDSALAAQYSEIRTHLADKTWTIAQAKTYLDGEYPPSGKTPLALKLWRALDDIETLADLAIRVPLLTAGGTGPGAGAHPTEVLAGDIAALNLDYRMAVNLVSENSTSAFMINGAIQALGNKSLLGIPAGNTALANQFDVMGDTKPSMVANSQWHYGTEVRVAIEDQPLLRGGIVQSSVLASLDYGNVELLVDGYATKDFGDTHSLVLMADSLNVQNALLQMLPETQRVAGADTLQKVLKAASNLKAEWGAAVMGSDQGKAEGDVLENTLNSLADLVLGPVYAEQQRLKGSPDGGTWASTTDPTGGYTGRDKLYALLKSVTDSDLYKAAVAGTVTLELGPASSFASAARTDFGAFAALYSLSPFAFKLGEASAVDATLGAKWGTVYEDWKKDKTTKAAGASATDVLNVSDQWLKDRALLLDRKNYYNTTNASYDSSKPDAYGQAGATQYDLEDVVWEDRQSELKIQRGGTTGNTKHVVFGSDASEDNITGGDRNDRLFGGGGEDTISGLGGDDFLEGGSGLDTYTFTTGFGKDTILDSDGKGTLTLGGVALTGGKYDTNLRTWAQVVGADTYVYEVRASGTTKQLVIHKKDDTAYTNSITINNFDVSKANSPEGYLGIKFDSTIKLALNDEPGVNYWATHTDTTSLLGDGSVAIEGGGEILAISLGTPAKANDTLTLAMGAYAANFVAILGDSKVPANGAVITLKEGQTDVRISLVQTGDITEDINTTISATYKSADPEGPQGVLSNSWAITVKDAGVASNTFIGDQHPQLDAANNYKWNETTWAADGTLVNGVVEPDFNDVLVGTAGVDKITGLGGNDALGGGDGNDQMDGGDGDDLIAGGNGSDTIKGGAGNDHIFSSANLQLGSGIRQVGLRVSSDDTWTMPAGDTLWKKGSTWGISQDPQGLVVFPFSKLTQPDAAPDVIEAGDGNDEVVAGLGDDRIDGGLGNDALTGAGGNDVIDGSDGSDFIQGDGDNNPVSLLYTAVANHGNDFLDGGLGDDQVIGQGGDDSLYGGADDDRLYGDDNRLASALPGANNGRDYLDGEDGNDMLWGGGKEDTLYGGKGDDQMWGDAGKDVLSGEFHGADYMNGGEGSNTMKGGGKDDFLVAGSGNDVMWGDDVDNATGVEGKDHGNDFLDGGAGDDTLTGGGKDDVLVGGFGADVLIGDDQKANLKGEFHGKDTLDGGAGIDKLFGTGGDDLLLGGDGDDELNGDALESDLEGQWHGADTLDGGAGKDKLWGQGGNDTLFGGAGNDVMRGDAAQTELAGQYHGADTMDGGEGDDWLYGDGGADTLMGGDGNDVLVGDSENGDVDAQWFGNDVLIGGAGDDFLYGGGGDDTLDGGSGMNGLKGGAGNDTYLANAADAPITKSVVDGANLYTFTTMIKDSEGSNTVVIDALRGDITFANTQTEPGFGLHWAGDTAGVYFENQGTADHMQVQFADGTTASVAQLKADAAGQVVVRYSTTAGDTVTGGTRDDILGASGALTVLNGGLGNDTITLDGAGQTVQYQQGDGVDLVGGSGSGAIVELKGAFNVADLRLEVDGQGQMSVLLGAGVDDHLRLDMTQAEVSTSTLIDHFVLDDGSTLSFADLLARGIATHVNRAPVVVTPLMDQVGTPTTPFSYVVPGDAFADADVGDNLTYAAKLADGSDLPTWLVFDPVSRSFSGTPLALGTLSVRVTANDAGNLTVSDVFDLVVGSEALYSPPTQGNDAITGSAYADTIDALDGNDTIHGAGGDDVLRGSAGLDKLYGDAGNDTLIGGAAQGDSYRGDELYGGDGNDTLSDGQLMDGGLGKDTYKVFGADYGYQWGSEYAPTVVVGDAGGGDLVRIGGGWGPGDVVVTKGGVGTNIVLPDLVITNRRTGQAVRLQGQTKGTDSAAPIAEVRFDSAPEVVWTAADLRNMANTGDAADNIMMGYADVANTLLGNAGNDSLTGGKQADTLDGGTGNDTLSGDLGNDIYVFGQDSDADSIWDADGTNGNIVQLKPGVTVANVQLTRTAQCSSGEVRANDALILTLSPSGATLWINEFFQPNAVGTVSEIRFNDGSNTVWRYSDVLARAGTSVTGVQNTQTGTAADDTFMVDNPQDVIIEAANGGTDTIKSTVSLGTPLPANVENLELIGPFALRGVGNSLDNVLRGNDGDNELMGYGGTDQFFGGKGDDTYVDMVWGSSTTTHQFNIFENANEGFDTLVTDASGAVLPDNVERLIVKDTSYAYHTYTGNALDNVIDVSLDANHGTNVRIDGGAGNDVMTGSRNTFNTYVVDSAGDVVNELIRGNGEVEASVSYTLDSRLANLKLTGSEAINGTGNQFNNTLDGSTNTAANVLTGLGGDDVYRVGALDTVVEAADGGNDTVIVAGLEPGNPNPTLHIADWANIESLELDMELGDANIVGDAGNNKLVGSRGANVIDGLDGDDILYNLNASKLAVQTSYPDSQDHLNGGNGNDSIFSYGGSDVIDGGSGNDTIQVTRAYRTKVDGGLGNDAIQVTGGGDISIDGGAGNDVITSDGGDGSHAINVQFGMGSGNDVVTTGNTRSAASWSSVPSISSTLTLSAGTDASSLRFNRSGASLVVSLDGGADSVTLSNFFESDASSAIQSVMDTIVLNDGTMLTRDAIVLALGKADLQTPTAGNDLLIVSTANHTQSGGAGDDTLLGQATDDQLDGGSGNDVLNGGNGVDQLTGGEGDDTLTGGLGADRYKFSLGWGHDVVDDKQWDARYATLRYSELYPAHQLLDDGSIDSIEFDSSVLSTDIVMTVSGRNLELTHKVTGDSIVLQNYYAKNSALYGPVDRQKNVSIRFSDNTVWDQAFIDRLAGTVTGTDGDDVLFMYTPGGQILGLAGNDQLIASAETASLYGGDGDDQLSGATGDDLLDGGAGADTMYGGAGADTYVVDDVADTYAENASEGTDLVLSGITHTLGANVENLTLTGTSSLNATGNSLTNILTGNSGNNTLSGGTGTDTMKGGAGDDTYVVDNVGDVVTENATEGIDLVQSKVTYTLGANVENLTLTGTSAINGTGNGEANTLIGNSANNTLSGGAGDDVLDGKAGIDTMVGGIGNDSYVVDALTDVVTELTDEGVDSISTGITYTLGVNVENLTLTGTGAINGTGNAAANVITGNTGNNVLDGAAGNDVYLIALSGGQDTIQEAVDASPSKLNILRFGAGINSANTIVKRVGSDLVVTFTGNTQKVTVKSFYLNADSGNTSNPVQRIEFVDGGISWDLANIDQKVNAANTINGTAGADTLTGTAAVDIINGLAGNDTIDGGAGADTLVGGSGNDSYKVDNIADVVTELAGEGTDLVTASVSYTLAANIENLTLSGTGSINATGNAAVNTLTGNAGSNVLDGGAGVDTMIGGAGNDTYYVDNTADVTTEAASAGTDLVIASVNWTLATNLENLTLTGTGNLNGTGNTAANRITGNAGDNILDGGTGTDTLIGGAGNDTYVINVAADIVTENASEGTDTVKSAATYTLGANLENLTLTGTSTISGTGNTLNNVLTGNTANNTLTGGAGDDVLDGGTGTDTLVGGTGNDTYFLDVSTDVVTETASEGADTINAAFTYTLSANLENLTLTGSTAINGTGNVGANVLVGNTGANTLTGNAGNDTLDGKAGADSLIGGTGNDTYTLGRGYGADTITENDATAGNTDIALFGADIAVDQLWFLKVGNNLEVDIIGTSDKFTLTNWYLGNQYHVEQFKTSDGKVLLDSQVQALVDAMAAFSPPAAGQTTLAANYATALNPVLAANWH